MSVIPYLVCYTVIEFFVPQNFAHYRQQIRLEGTKQRRCTVYSLGKKGPEPVYSRKKTDEYQEGENSCSNINEFIRDKAAKKDRARGCRFA